MLQYWLSWKEIWNYDTLYHIITENGGKSLEPYTTDKNCLDTIDRYEHIKTINYNKRKLKFI